MQDTYKSREQARQAEAGARARYVYLRTAPIGVVAIASSMGGRHYSRTLGRMIADAKG